MHKLSRRRKPLTLLEVIIAMGLTTLLLGILFRFYHQVSMANLQAHQVQQKIFSLSLFQEKMAHLFSQLSQEEEENDTLSFCTKEVRESVFPALVFKYDNGVDPDPAFCNTLRGMLFLGKEKCLSLVSWPENDLPRSEVLLDEVSSISFRFFDTSELCWRNSWEKEIGSLPHLIEISIQFLGQDKEAAPWKCVFFALRDDTPVLYHQKRAGP